MTTAKPGSTSTKPAVKAKPAAPAKQPAAKAVSSAKPATQSSKPVTPLNKPETAPQQKLAGKVPSPASKPIVVPEEKPRKKESDKKVKLVRDSFTMPEADYALFKDLKARSLANGLEVKKSELLRAALNLLASLNDKELTSTLGALEKIKTGRPAKKG